MSRSARAARLLGPVLVVAVALGGCGSTGSAAPPATTPGGARTSVVTGSAAYCTQLARAVASLQGQLASLDSSPVGPVVAGQVATLRTLTADAPVSVARPLADLVDRWAALSTAVAGQDPATVSRTAEGLTAATGADDRAIGAWITGHCGTSG